MRARRLGRTALVSFAVLGAGLAFGGGQALAVGVEPTIEGLNSTAPTPFTVNLEAQVNPENEEATCEFAYGTTASYGTEMACEQGATLNGEGQTATVSLAGLNGNTKYYYRLLVKNATGSAEASGEITTPVALAPSVVSESVASLTSTDATLEVKLNPNYQETAYSFEYATSEALLGTAGASKVAGAPPAPLLPAVFEEQTAGPVDLGGGLAPGTTYYYRVDATNNAGTATGPLPAQSFTTLDVPVVATGEAREVTRDSAALNGSVNPAGAPTNYYFSYVDEAGYRTALAEGASDPYGKGGSTQETTSSAGYGGQPTVPLSALNLQPGTTYHYALLASNSVGAVRGADETFTTPPAIPPPVAISGETVGIASGTATLTGSVETSGLATAASFEFGPVPYSGTFEVASALAGASSPEGVSFAFNGYLLPSTTYYYRVVASNEAGVSYGAERSFTTAGFATGSSGPVTPLLAYTTVDEVKSEGATSKGSAPKGLSKAQKLAKALRACKKEPRRKHAGCEKLARRRFG